MTPDTSLAVALLALYAPLALPIIYITIRHGVKGFAIVGWIFLFFFCTIRLIGCGMQVHDPNSTGAAIISSVGLSPLLLATSGILHEALYYRNPVKTRSSDAQKYDAIALILYHMLVMAGVAILAVGAANLVTDTDQAARDKDNNLTRAGISIMFVAYVVLIAWALVPPLLARRQQRAEKPGYRAATTRRGRVLYLAVLAALPLLGVRVVASIVYFAGTAPGLSPVNGSIGLRVGLELVEELLVTIIFVVAGIVTRNVDESGVGRV